MDVLGRAAEGAGMKARQAFAIARATARNSETRFGEVAFPTCIAKGHSVHWVGPYRICRSLFCPFLVVETR